VCAGANDNIMAGQSTFMIELQETASILQHATPASLVILDELGRGTATFDGYSIAYAVLEHLSRKVGCRTLFSTHYHMLTDEVVRNPHIALKHMSCHIDDDRYRPRLLFFIFFFFSATITERVGLCVCEFRKEVTFLYKVADGVCPKSYGMNVARMAVRTDHALLISPPPLPLATTVLTSSGGGAVERGAGRE
jgi:DNA mismatch repair protein MSH6